MTAPQTTVLATPDIGVPGQIADLNGAADAITFSKTNKEASASMPFGIMVKQGTLDDDVLLLTAAANKLAGIVLFDHDFHRDSELTSAGLKPGTTFGVGWQGPFLVTVEDAVTPASGVHIRHTTGVGGTQPGAFRGTAEATHTLDASAFARFLSSAGVGGVAELWIDLSNAALATADT